MTPFPQKNEIRVNKKPEWMPQPLWDAVQSQVKNGAFHAEVRFSRAERKVMRKRKPIKVSDWAERHRVLTASALPGPWKNDVTPYLVGIMDAAARPHVREIILCKCPQSGGTEAAHNFVGHRIDRAAGPVMYIYPDEKTGTENMQDRIIPMIKSSPRLKRFLTGQERDTGSYRVNLQHMKVYIGWAGSVSSLANKPIRYAIADEIDKDGFYAGKKETSPLNLIDKRLVTYRSVSKFFKLSTPTTEEGNIWRELNENTDVIFDYWVRCPFCDHLQLMKFEGIRWEGGHEADPKEIRNKHLAWYECEDCEGRWDDDVRNMAVRKGVWMDREEHLALDTYLEKRRPANIGFHLPAWNSYFVSLSECAAAFLLGLNDPVALQDFLNSYAAEPWQDRVESKNETEILNHKNDLPAGVVPEWAVALTCGIDMQKHGFWYVVRAWSRELNNHLVQSGWIDSWSAVEQLVFNTRYPMAGDSGGTMAIWRAALDTGGGPDGTEGDWSKTEEAYEWIRKNGRGVVHGIKGANRPQVKKVNPRTIDKMARGNRPIPGGLVLYYLDVDQFKDQFHWRLSRAENETQHMTLNADTDIEYARQILAEQKQKDRKGKVSWVQVRRDNHLFDCEIYAAACADPEWTPSLVWLAARQETKTKTTPRDGGATKQSTGASTRSRPSWFRGR